MSKRLRAYLQALAERHILFAIALIFAHNVMEGSSAFSFVLVIPWFIWSLLYGAIGLLAWYAKRHKNADLGRLAAGGAVLLGIWWGVSFIWSGVVDRALVSPLGAILFMYLARKDYIILGIPFSAAWDDILDNAEPVK